MTGAVETASYHDTRDLYDLMLPAFLRAYPELAPDSLQHTVRNFIQVLSGIIDFADRKGLSCDGEVTQLELANCLVFWCIANSHLEDYFENGHSARSGPIPEGEVAALMKEFTTRAADWLVGMEALKTDPRLFCAFVKGSADLGADWVADRGELPL